MFKKVIAVAAGKGGVGKSTVSTLLAQLLTSKQYRVGLIDADLYGPSLSHILKVDQPPKIDNSKLIPAKSGGISFISSTFFGYEEKPAAVRAPIVNHMISQFVHEVAWDDLDYLIVDFPPGTGDIQLTLLQTLNFNGAILVTTPQKVALKDVYKAYQMFQNMKVPLIGVIENMSYFSLDENRKIFPFGEGQVTKFCELNNLNYLGQIPIDENLSKHCDLGQNLIENASKGVLKEMESALNKILYKTDQEKEKDFSLKRVDDFHFDVIWSSKDSMRYKLSTLQKNCPCSKCQTSSEVKISESVMAKNIETVGNYAIKVHFTSGCSRGVFTLKLLKELGTKL